MPAESLTLLEASLYGCIQGLTEFLPVSSSGHLALAHQLGLGHIDDALMRPFSVLLHVATLAAVLFAFRREIYTACKHLDKRSLRNASLSVVPAVIFGFSLSSFLAQCERSMLLLGICFLCTAFLLLLTDRLLMRRLSSDSDQVVDDRGSDLSALTVRQAIFVGIGQACALFPGVSRSGSSLCAAILSGVETQRAFSYSFLVGIPLIAGAALHEYLLASEFDLMIEAIGWTALLWAMLCSLLSGIAAIALLRYVLKKRCLSIFGIYCAVLAGMCLVFVIME